jgi:hypothetical protein
MNKIKISDSDKRLLIIFFAIVILACSYFFIFNKGMTKASELEAQNEQDSAKVQQMQQMEASLPQVKENIENMKQTQADIIAKYPSDMTTEKSIESLQDYEDHSSDFHITDITFAMRMPLVGAVDTTAADSSADTADETTDGAADSAADDTSATADTQSAGEKTDDAAADASADTVGNVAGYYASIGIRYEASYNGLKEMIAYVNAFQDRTTITQFTAAFDDATGKLTGEMTLNMYYITNTGKEYVPPVFDFMPKGVSNIFGKTIERSQEALGDPY